MIISGFAGSGKTTAVKELPNSIDLESSDYQWTFLNTELSVEERKGIDEKIKNENFIDDYVSAIEEANKTYDYVFIAAQPEVLNELDNRGLSYLLVTPDLSLKSTFIQRYIDRGNNESFINLMSNNFESFIESMVERSKQSNVNIEFLDHNKPYLINIFK